MNGVQNNGLKPELGTFWEFADGGLAEKPGDDTLTAIYEDPNAVDGPKQRVISKDRLVDGDDAIGRVWRSKRQKDLNNEVRTTFLKAVIAEFGGFDKIPQNVRKALELSKFSIVGDTNGSDFKVTSGKPLSARRIRAVLNAVSDFKSGKVDITGKPQSTDSVGKKGELGSAVYVNEIVKHISASESSNATGTISPSTSKNGIKNALLGFMEMIQTKYGSSRIRDRPRMYEIINQMADKLAGLTVGSACNCHVIGHKNLNNGKNIYGLLEDLLQCTGLNYNQRSEVLEKGDGLQLIEGLLKQVGGIDLDKFERGNMRESDYNAKVAEELLIQEKNSYLKEIVNVGGFPSGRLLNIRRDQKIVKLNNILNEAKEVYKEVCTEKAGQGMFMHLTTKKLDGTKPLARQLQDLGGTFFGDFLIDSLNYSENTIDHANLWNYNDSKEYKPFTVDEMKILCGVGA